MITIFTDGSSKGNPGPGGWGAVISYKLEVSSEEEELVTEIGGYEPQTTNNRMELTAVIEALKFIEKLEANTYNLEANLHTDSEYVLKGITSWIHGWQKNNWRTAARKPVINQDLWKELIEASKGKEIKWTLVRGHSGVPANERCDEIATSFADQVMPALYNNSRKEYGILFSHAPRV